MKVSTQHGWKVSVGQAKDIQSKLAEAVCRKMELGTARFVAGVDISVNRVSGTATGAVVVLNYPDLELAEVRLAQGKLEFPYVPGLLSFREAPLMLEAYQKLDVVPDLILVDGQGIAHPRRLGIASHLGLWLDKPTIGCAKSRLCGEHGMPGDGFGDYTELVYEGEVVGAVLRTKPGVNPLYISVGHRVDLQGAIDWVLNCCCGYRLPEPTRFAHLAAGGNLTAGGK
jgi:deoxyribonuclease V